MGAEDAHSLATEVAVTELCTASPLGKKAGPSVWGKLVEQQAVFPGFLFKSRGLLQLEGRGLEEELEEL